MPDATNSPAQDTNQPPPTSPSFPPIGVPEEWRRDEARLKLNRSELEEIAKAQRQQLIELLGAMGKDPFALVNLAIQDAQKDAENGSKTNSPPQPTPTSPPPPIKQPATNSPSKPGTNSAALPDSMDVADDPELPEIESDTEGTGSETQDAASEVEGPTTDSAQPGAQAADKSFNPPESDAFGTASSQAQASADRMLAAFQQNTQLTGAMFDQMLALINSQNQKLGDVDRKIAELTGQLDSIKNP